MKALESVLSILLMIAAGFCLAKRRWFEGGSSSLIVRLIVSVALPAYMISNLMGSFDRAKLLSLLPGLPIPFAVMLASFAVALALAALFRIPASRRGTFASMFGLSNTIFIGLPVNLILFGEESLSYVILYYVANTCLFWTIGTYGIARDGALRAGGAAPSLFSREGLRRVLSPPLAAFFAATAMILVGIRLPRLVLDFCKNLGSMTTPLSMLFIGSVIAGVDWKQLRLERSLVLILVGRFLIAPAILILIVGRTGLPILMKKVFLIQATMPAMTQTPILAKAYGADVEYAGIATSFTTVMSLATIPLYMGLVNLIF